MAKYKVTINGQILSRKPDLARYTTFIFGQIFCHHIGVARSGQTITVSPELLQRCKGKPVAVQFTESGWQIIDGADDLEQHRDSLLVSGVDLDTLILDRIPSDEEAEVADGDLPQPVMVLSIRAFSWQTTLESPTPCRRARSAARAPCC